MHPLDVRHRRDPLLLLCPPRIAMSLVVAATALHLLFPIAVLQPSRLVGFLLGAVGFAIMLCAAIPGFEAYAARVRRWI